MACALGLRGCTALNALYNQHNVFAPLPAKNMLDQLLERIPSPCYSLRTEIVYVHWVRFFIRFYRPRHPAQMSAFIACPLATT